jgi:hypothetical protein
MKAAAWAGSACTMAWKRDSGSGTMCSRLLSTTGRMSFPMTNHAAARHSRGNTTPYKAMYTPMGAEGMAG